MRCLRIVLFCLFASVVSVASAQLKEEKLSFKDRLFVVKGDKQFAPFEFVNADGEPDGFSVELFKAIMKRLGLKYTLRLDDWGKVRDELKEKKIDMVVGMIYSKERAEKVRFGIPHCMISYNIVCRKNNDYANLDLLKDKSIIVQNRDRAHDYLLLSGLTNKIVAVDNIAEAVRLLASGKHDALLSFDISSCYFVEQGGYKDLLVHLTDLVPERYSIAVNADNEDLLYLLNTAIYQMKVDGEYDKIYRKWFGVYEEPQISGVVWFVLALLGGCLILFGVFLLLLRLKVRSATRELKEKNERMELLVEKLKDENCRKMEIEKNLIEAKERAEESDRLKSAFLANMSHEIRTPLNAIVGFSSIICETEFEQERAKYLDIILKNNELLLQLINDVLDLSRIESGSLLMNNDYFQLSDLCSQALSLANRGLKQEEVQLLSEVNFDCILYSDRSRVAQVLMNFLNNAFKFTTIGSITLCTKQLEDNWVEISVVDTGIGIEEEKRKMIFERFVKLDAFSQGTGLGLSICKNIVDRLDGKIGVDSEVGVGSKFWIRLAFSEKI